MSRHIRPLPAHPGPEARWPPLPRRCGYDEILAEKPECRERTNYGGTKRETEREREKGEEGKEGWEKGEMKSEREGEYGRDRGPPGNFGKSFSTTVWSGSAVTRRRLVFSLLPRFCRKLPSSARGPRIFVSRSYENGVHATTRREP